MVANKKKAKTPNPLKLVNTPAGLRFKDINQNKLNKPQLKFNPTQFKKTQHKG